MGSLKSPCRTSYRSSIDTIALNCFVFEKIAFLCTYFWRQTDKRTDGQTDKQVDNPYALSRLRCRERRTNISQSVVSFQQCCYGRWEQLLTVPSYDAGSALLYNPSFYSSLYYQHDLRPKEWCCLFSGNCYLYYRVRPLDRCLGYRFPRFGQ